jgi:hypothetical protein
MKEHSPYYFTGKSKAISGATALDTIEAIHKTALTIDFFNVGAGALTNAVIEGSMEETANFIAIDGDFIKGLTTLKTLAATTGKARIIILTQGLIFIKITLTGSTTINYNIVGYDVTTSGNFSGTGGGASPIEVFVKNDIEGDDYRNPGDFTATPTNGTSLIVLSVDALGGNALTEAHFNHATLNVYKKTVLSKN